MLTVEEANRIILKNKGLVGHIALRYIKNYEEFDDFFQVGCIGLIKGVYTFDKHRNIAFTTYAGKCINNEILMYLRTEKKYRKDVSLDEPPRHSSQDERRCIEDFYHDAKQDFIESLVEDDIFCRCIDIALNTLCKKDELIFLYVLSGMTQLEVGKKFGLTQSYVSRKYSKIVRILQTSLKKTQKFTKLFKVVKHNNYYIFCISKEVKNLEKVLKEYNISARNFNLKPELDIMYEKDEVRIYIKEDENLFSILALIMQQFN